MEFRVSYPQGLITYLGVAPVQGGKSAEQVSLQDVSPTLPYPLPRMCGMPSRWQNRSGEQLRMGFVGCTDPKQA
jgi:hypothetical protein